MQTIQNNLPAIIKRIEERRAALGLSQRAVSEKATLSPGYFRDLIVGRSKNPGIDQLTKIALALDTSLDALLGYRSTTPENGISVNNEKNTGHWITHARGKLGDIWGLTDETGNKRPLSRAELARALDLSPEHGGSHISKLERGQATLSGPIRVCIELMLAGGVPSTMKNVVRPGYPRGPAR